jgi:hypothetical protein
VNLDTIIAALAWGVVSGYLILHVLDSALGIVFCLHGLLKSRWKRLANRCAPGQISYAIILRLLLRIALYALLYGFLLEIGDSFVRRTFGFAYRGGGGLLWAVTAGSVAALFLRATRRRLIVVWKISHQFDYAEKRQRTFLLKK